MALPPQHLLIILTPSPPYASKGVHSVSAYNPTHISGPLACGKPAYIAIGSVGLRAPCPSLWDLFVQVLVTCALANACRALMCDNHLHISDCTAMGVFWLAVGARCTWDVYNHCPVLMHVDKHSKDAEDSTPDDQHPTEQRLSEQTRAATYCVHDTNLMLPTAICQQYHTSCYTCHRTGLEKMSTPNPLRQHSPETKAAMRVAAGRSAARPARQSITPAAGGAPARSSRCPASP